MGSPGAEEAGGGWNQGEFEVPVKCPNGSVKQVIKCANPELG